MTEQSKVEDNSDIYGARAEDGLLNVVSNLGTKKARDPYTKLSFDRTLDRVELEDIYRYYWISKAVDIKPWDMTREWRTFDCSDTDDKAVSAIEEVERMINIRQKYREALTWSSVYGGSGIVMHVKGHGDMDMPLDVTKVKKDQLERISVADRWNLIERTPIDYNPISEHYGTAEWYYIANDTNFTKIHRSRIIFFRGRKMPVRVERQLKVWGDSDIQRWYKAITNSETLAAGIIEGVHQANIDVVGVKGLAHLLAQREGEKKATDRFMMMDMCKSMLNMSIVDAEDSFTRNAFPFAGLPDLYKTFLDVLSSATDIPTTRLLGSSPSGMNATGESDTRNYYDMIKSWQVNQLDPALYPLDQVMVRSALGTYPDELCYEWNSLWQMTPTEEATLRQTQVATLQSLQSLGVDDLVLQRDAVELGLVKNLTSEQIDAMEAADSFEDDVDEFDDEEGDLDSMINELVGEDDPKKKGNLGPIKTSETGKKYRESASGNRVYVGDELNFKEEKHKRDKGGQFSSTGGGGASAQKNGGNSSKSESMSDMMKSDKHEYLKLRELLSAKYNSSSEFDYSKGERKKLRELSKEHKHLRSIGGDDADETEIEKFNDWFGDSKVSNSDGKPIPMFHGGVEFDKFKVGHDGLIFFTPDADWARDFGAELDAEEGDETPVYEVYLKAENPFSARNQDHINLINDAAGKEIVELGFDGFDDLQNDEVVSAAKKAGFDAINMVEVSEDHGGADGIVESIAVFDPSQIFINHFSEYGEQGYH